MLEVVNVERSSNLKGKDRITLKVHSIQTESGTYPVATSQVELKGHSEGKKGGSQGHRRSRNRRRARRHFRRRAQAPRSVPRRGGTTGAVIAGSGKNTSGRARGDAASVPAACCGPSRAVGGRPPRLLASRRSSSRSQYVSTCCSSADRDRDATALCDCQFLQAST